VTLATERLLIRPVAVDDWRAIQAIWADESLSPLARYDRPNDLSDDAVRPRVARWSQLGQGPDHYFFAVCLRDAVIGYVAFNRRGEDAFETGYCFHSAFHGRGYAREALGALIGFMRGRGARVITAGTALENRPSAALLAALGFTMTGTERVSFYKDADGRDIFFDGGLFELPLAP